MKNYLTYLEAYEVMNCFLTNYYEKTSSDDVGSLLGDIQILKDEESADPAAWEDWINCVQKVIPKNGKD